MKLICACNVSKYRRKGDTHYSMQILSEKPRIRETKHLSTNTDSSTDTTVGWTKNTQKPNFFEKRKKLSETQKLKNV